MRASASPAPARWPRAPSSPPLRVVSPSRPLRAAAAGAGTGGVALRFAIAAVPLVAALAAWRGVSYWEYSEGAYALTARMLLDGSTLYGDVVAAQPPLLFYLAAAVLAVDDSLEALRAALTLPLLATGLLVALAVRRLTGNRVAAVVGGLAALVAPWTLHEGTLLMPETFAAPLLMGAALVGSSPSRARWAGALAALAASFKLAFALSPVALGLASGRRRAYALGAATTLAALWALLLAAHGPPLVENVFAAQLQSGRHAPRLVAGLWLQAAWNLAPLVVLAALAWPLRRRARDARLLLSLTALAVGSGALLLTLVKHGSYLNVLAVAEPPLVALATCSAWWLLASRIPAARSAASPGPPPATRRPTLARGGAALAVALVAVQSASLLVSPARPALFARPLSDAPHGRALSSDGVRTAARRLADCAPRPWARVNPFLAFVAGRPAPGGQPDRFIVRHAGLHAAVRRRALVSAGAERPCARRAPSRLARAGA